MIDIVSADRGHIRAALRHLRADDAAEMAACDIDLHRLPDVIVRHKVFAFAACTYDVDDPVVAVWGMLPRRPGVGAGFAFGTDQWGLAVRPMLRQIRRFVLPFLRQNGYHRVEAAALARRLDVFKFMALIGAEPEGMLQGYGAGGEDFISYRWLANEHGIAQHLVEDHHPAH
jgi:hypothetical protein